MLESSRHDALAVLLWTTSLFVLSSCGSDAANLAGCASEDDCRGDRVCVQGVCMNPDAPTPGDMSSADTGLPDMTPPPDPADMTTPPDMPVDPPDLPVDPPDMTTPPDMPVDPPDMPVDPPPVLGPQLEVAPGDVGFGLTTVGSMTSSTLVVTNVGDEVLLIESLDLRDRPSQAFDVSPVVGSMGPTPIAPGQSETFSLSYAPQQEGQFQNFVDITSNDLDDPEVEVELNGRGIDPIDRPCLFSSPDVLDFGLVTPGGSRTLDVTMGNCSQNDIVTVTGVRFEDATMPFTATSPMAPFVLQVGQSVTVPVKFEPNTADDFETRLMIRSDSEVSPTSFVEVEGTSGGCGEAIVLGENAIDSILADRVRDTTLATLTPGEQVVLDGSDSVTTSGQSLYNWAVTTRPMGSSARLSMPMAPSTRFVPDVPGRYVFELDVVDALTGQGACDKATIELIAFAPTPQLAASISWNAPHDVDLHVLRSDQGMFPGLTDPAGDLFYDSPSQDWGVMGSTTDDGVFLGDAREGGEEGALLGALEPGRTYRVIAQYTRPGARRPVQFDVTATVTVTDPTTGNADTQVLTESFRLNQFNRAWAAFDIDGTTGQVTPAAP